MYDKIKIIVICKDEQDIHKYRRLFRFMLKDQLNMEIVHKDFGRLETDKLRIEFHAGRRVLKGHRAHYVINMVQDVDYHNEVALPTTNIHWYLKEDPQWAELFEDAPLPYRAVMRKYDDKWQFKSNFPEEDWWDEVDEMTALKRVMKQGWTLVLDRGQQDGLYSFKKERANNENIGQGHKDTSECSDRAMG